VRGRRQSIVAPLRRRDFALLWSGVSVSLVGDGIYYVAIAWQAYTLSNSPTALSLVGVAWTAPMLAFLLFGGSVSDRLDRRRVMVCASLLQAFSLALIGILAINGLLRFPLLLGLVALAGAAMGFFSPAFGAVVPGLVAAEELPATSALEQLVRPISLQLLGPALGGVLVGLSGPGVAFLVDAATFAFAASMIASISSEGSIRQSAPAKRSRLGDIGEGLRFVRANGWLWGTLLAAGLSLFAAYGPAQVLLPFLLKNQLHLGGGAFGVVRSLVGLGAVSAALAIGRAGLPQRFVRVMFVAWALQALAGVGYGIASSEWGFALISFASGLCAAIGNVIWGTLLKTQVPNQLLGRVSSLDWLVSIGLVPVSFAITGPLAALLGSQTTLIVAGSFACGIMILAAIMPAMRDPELRPLAAG
jgi:MFS family permease